MTVEQFIIDNESEANDYLNDLLEKPEYRSIDEISIRAHKYIKDENIKIYFINKAKEILKTYGHEIA